MKYKLLSIIVALAPTISFAETANKYLGASTCASSACHGNPSPLKGGKIPRNEFTLWSKHDSHSKAFSALTSPDGRKISENLGISNPEKSNECLPCHSTTSDMTRVGLNFRMEEGITCERCHGAAEAYLKSHARTSTSHEQNIRNGLVDLASPLGRANICLDCHQGTTETPVNHRLYGAGHPRIDFELNTYSEIQPRHFQIDADYVERNGHNSAAQQWLAGQLVMAQRLIQSVKSASPRPELSTIYCSSCHHSLKSKQFRTRHYGKEPGILRLNKSKLQLAALGVALIDSEISRQLLDAVRALKLDSPDKDLSKIGDLVAESIKKFSKIKATPGDFKNTLKALLQDVTQQGASPYYEYAEQIAMAVGSLSSGLEPKNKGLEAAINAIYQTLEDPDAYKPDLFTSSCRAFMKLL